MSHVVIGQRLADEFRSVVDEKDEAYAALAEANRAKLPLDRPLMGDYLRLPWYSNLQRFSHDWGSHVQYTKHGCGNFYICADGDSQLSSGSLETGLRIENLHPTDEFKEADFWFFHHGHAGAHRGVYCKIKVRVWEYRNQNEGKP
jgi:hypothetical protein